MTGTQRALNSYLVQMTGKGLHGAFLQARACRGVARELALAEPRRDHSPQLASRWLAFTFRYMYFPTCSGARTSDFIRLAEFWLTQASLAIQVFPAQALWSEVASYSDGEARMEQEMPPGCLVTLRSC